jgi:hypothetical protein
MRAMICDAVSKRDVSVWQERILCVSISRAQEYQQGPSYRTDEIKARESGTGNLRGRGDEK